MRILLAEDVEDHAVIYCALLRRQGHAVTWENTIKGTIQRLQEEPFDLLILDLMMPEGSGFRVLGYLKAAKKAVKTLVITGTQNLRNSVSKLGYEIDGFECKPFDLGRFVNVVNTLSAPEAKQSLGGSTDV